MNLLGEIWESFFVEGGKVGFLRRVTAVSDNPNILTTTLFIIYGTASFRHEFFFYNEPGYPAHSYLFDTNDGAPVQARFAENQMICQVDEDIFTETVPDDARPSYGNYPLVVTMPFEEDFTRAYTQIDDGSGTVQGKVELISHGWEDVIIDGEQLRLWLVGEHANGQLSNRYWLDENGRIRHTQWRGAISYWVPNRDKAFRGLPTELIEYAHALFAGKTKSDWFDDIEAWLDQS